MIIVINSEGAVQLQCKNGARVIDGKRSCIKKSTYTVHKQKLWDYV